MSIPSLLASPVRGRPSRPVRLHPRRGFTLIELLVVIAIIALLIGILLPTLAKARKQALIVKCTSNVGQIAKAWQSYLIDYDESFPLIDERGLSYQWTYGGYAEGDALDGLTREERALNPYLGLPHPATLADVSVFRCPEEDLLKSLRSGPGFTIEGALATKTFFEVYGNSYQANAGLMQHQVFDQKGYDAAPNFSSNHSRIVPTRLAMVEFSLSTVVMIADFQAYQSASGLGNWDASWHDDDHYSNVGFLDGHARFMQIQEGVGRTADYTFGIRKTHWTEKREAYAESLQTN